MLSYFWEKYGRFAFLGIGVGLIILGLFISFSSKDKAGDIEFLDTNEASVVNQTRVVVNLSGAVNKPGVYELGCDSRLIDLIEKAEGLSSKADSQWVAKNLNLARKLKDEEKIYIPFLGEEVEQKRILGQSNLINLNTATKEQLEQLPGVGPATAEKIVNYREEFNGFKDTAEIKAVPGIGEKTFEKFKDMITI